MLRYTKILHCIVFRTGVFCGLLLAVSESRAAEPTLVQLSFWVPPERMAEFEVVYEKQILPILKRHNLVPFSGRGRTAGDSVFDRSFMFNTFITRAEFTNIRNALLSDPAFEKIRRALGATFGNANASGLMRLGFRLYQLPAGPGKQVVAGFGQGHWTTYGAPEGLALPHSPPGMDWHTTR